MKHMKQKKKHNYPKNRRRRNTSYSESYRIIEKYTLTAIRDLWINMGMYQTGYKLGTSPYVIRYLAHKYGWKRPASCVPALLKGVQAGKMPASHYKTLDFNNIKTLEN